MIQIDVEQHGTSAKEWTMPLSKVDKSGTWALRFENTASANIDL
jgi:hypothetical protein